MFDLPEHFQIGLTINGDGPVEAEHPDFARWGCWCGDRNCERWVGTWRE
jgi:hypothetical protein